ncbi:MAG: type II toxin-antitoxin system death-on-curing family toxin [Phycisphaerae bacterium]|nr:type II toxin-antitoxin system death-on-curing family toxin [Phycisphaerae bacterium]
MEYLTVHDVLAIHADQIARYGGDDGIRDAGLLDAAVAMPLASFDGVLLHADAFAAAAAYLYHLVQNHPFVDGNKRAGTAAALTFLDLNGIEIDVLDDELVELVVAVASGAATKADVAATFRGRARA